MSSSLSWYDLCAKDTNIITLDQRVFTTHIKNRKYR